MSNLWNSYVGYVIIRVEGLRLEVFLNALTADGIDVWDVRRRSRVELTVKMRYRDFKRMRPALRKSGSRVSVEKRVGLPFTLSRFKARRLLLLGAAVAVMIMLLLSSYVWSIELIGTDSEREKGELLEFLAQKGVHTGIFADSVDLREIERTLVDERQEIAWASVSAKGTRLNVEIVKKVPEPQMVDVTQPARIVASKDAVVAEITVMQGVPMVAAGQTVRAGQELIGCIFTYSNDPPRAVHAKGEVKARIFYEESAAVPLKAEAPIDTGNQEKLRYLCFGAYEWLLDGNANAFALYRDETLEQPLIGPGLYVNARWKTVVRYEQVEDTGEPDLEAKQKFAEEAAWTKVKAQLPDDATIKERTPAFRIKDGAMVCELRVETEELIGVTLNVQSAEIDRQDAERKAEEERQRQLYEQRQGAH